MSAQLKTVESKLEFSWKLGDSKPLNGSVRLFSTFVYQEVRRWGCFTLIHTWRPLCGHWCRSDISRISCWFRGGRADRGAGYDAGSRVAKEGVRTAPVTQGCFDRRQHGQQRCVCVYVCVCVSYLWRFEGVVCGEVNGQKEYPTLVRTVVLQQGKKKRFDH